jgi:hypothetical protein
VTCTIDVDEKVQDSVELPEPLTLFGATLHEVLLVLRLTILEKPFRPLTVTLDVPAEPMFTLTFVELPARAKSWTLYVTVTE